MTDQITVRVDEALLGDLETLAEIWTTNRADAVREAVRSYLALLAAERKTLQMSPAELGCLAEVKGGPMTEPGVFGPVMAYQYRDAEAPDRFGRGWGHAEKWGIDGEVLLEKLDALTPAQDMALRDGLARWWTADANPDAAGFAQFGFRTEPD